LAATTVLAIAYQGIDVAVAQELGDAQLMQPVQFVFGLQDQISALFDNEMISAAEV